MFLFIVTDLYDLNNSRVLIEHMAERGLPVHVFFLTTPLKPYRQVFMENRETLLSRVEMSDGALKYVGDVGDFSTFLDSHEFEYTFFMSSYYNLFKKINFPIKSPRMGKLCIFSWGFDGKSIAMKEPYARATLVFSEGPFFHSHAAARELYSKYRGKIHFCHPYYDLFNTLTKEECRKKLGISTDKRVILIPETGNIKNVKSRWSPLYLSIIKKVDRSRDFIVFKAREKTVSNPCRQTIAPRVDLYIENEWLYPPTSATVAIASDVCIMPCESRFALEAIFSHTSVVMCDQKNYKGKKARSLFAPLARRMRFNSIDGALRGPFSQGKSDQNIQNLSGDVVTFQEPSNCQYIMNLLGV